MNKWKKSIYYWYNQYGFETMHYRRNKQIDVACISLIWDVRKKEHPGDTKCGF